MFYFVPDAVFFVPFVFFFCPECTPDGRLLILSRFRVWFKTPLRTKGGFGWNTPSNHRRVGLIH